MSEAATSLRQVGGSYEIILADPPWRFASNSAAKPGKNAMGHYECLPLPEIKSLPVAEVAARDALLLMWTTAPFAQLSWDVLSEWGFKYVSQMVWVKDRVGTGFWARNRHEIVYIAKRGRFPCPRPAPFPDSVIEGQQRQHSRKPDRLHEMIDAAWPSAAKLEMFARESRAGWATWGNETGRFDLPPEVSFSADEDPELAALLGPDPDVEDLLA